MSANAVTIIAGMSWILSLPAVIVAGWLMRSNTTAAGWVMLFVSGFLWNAGYVLDLADGSLACMTKTANATGFYLDYVFHLLFKPAFLASIGIALFLLQDGGLAYLILAILAIPANWSASSAAAEHVLCEETAKGWQSPDSATDAAIDADAKQRLWLGSTDSHVSAQRKTDGAFMMMRVVAQEILSYYGQFTFFSITVLLDFIASRFWKLSLKLPVTTVSFVLLSVFLISRVPFRVWRDYKRIRDGMHPRS